MYARRTPRKNRMPDRRTTLLRSDTARNKSSDARSERSFRSLAENFAVFIGIPALTLYPLGFVSLWIQLMAAPYFPYALDRQMAWYAASLVDRTVVIGTGVHVLFLSLGATGFLAGFFFFLLALLRGILGLFGRRQNERQTSADRRWTLLRRSLFFLLVLGLGMYVIVVNQIPTRLAYMFYAFSSPEIQTNLVLRNKVVFKLVCLLVAVLLIVVIGSIAARHLMRQSRRPSYPRLGVAYVGIVLAASLLAGSEYPSLPTVQFYETPVAAQDRQFLPDPYATLSTPAYTVLSSREELWYVFAGAEGVIAVPIQDVAVAEFHAINEVYAGTYMIEATCRNFLTQEEAQVYLESLSIAEDRAPLDPDNDGIACEELEN